MLAPIARIARLKGNTFAHQTSWPWVNATVFCTPALLIDPESNPSGAAAPKAATLIFDSLIIRDRFRATRGVGSKILERSRITVTPN